MPESFIFHRIWVQNNPEEPAPLRLAEVYRYTSGYYSVKWRKLAAAISGIDGLWLTTWIRNYHYVVKFLISERLAVDLIIETVLLNEHIINLVPRKTLSMSKRYGSNLGNCNVTCSREIPLLGTQNKVQEGMEEDENCSRTGLEAQESWGYQRSHLRNRVGQDAHGKICTVPMS